ncbi:MAG: cadmium-translocating P-type ATPase [Candidatus Zixiibacteriota bacterium]|nr:MAG: cadmium-translocating P-type ATPase [candidate division Zixibacteria bacterium]
MATLRIEAATTQIDCPNCARTAEDEIKRIEGVSGARIDFLNSRIYYSFDQDTVHSEDLRKRIEELGHFKFAEEGPSARSSLPFSRKLLILISVALVLTLLGLAVEHLANLTTAGRVLIYAAIAVGGWEIVKKATIGLRHKRVDMNTLMSLAVIGAAAIGKLDEAVVVVLLFGTANLLESFSLWKFSRSLTDLHDFTSGQALLKQGDTVLAVTPESLQIGDIVVVREGMKIPADGRIASGNSALDLSSLTGEPQPQQATEGDEVFAGSVNLQGYIEVQVTAPLKDSRIGKILRMVGDVAERKAKLERLVDRFAHIYTPIVVALAVAVAVFPPLLFDGAFGVWFYRALVFLVISCPCALVISTPVAVTAALAAGSRMKAIIKGGDAIERLAQAKKIAFDKTGTLTTGALQLGQIECFDGLGQDEAIQIAASLERISNHPVAKAVRNAVSLKGLQLLSIDDLRSINGFGVEGHVDGRLYRIGGIEFLNSDDRETQPQRECSYLVCDGRMLARFGFEEKLRPETTTTISKLREQGFESVGLLSGDRREIIETLRAKLQLDFGVGQLMPEEKYDRLRTLGDNVAMVGDGINDAVALSGSDVSIAIGRLGNDIPAQHADVVLFGNSISNLPHLFRLGKRTVALIRTNIIFAFAIKVVFLGLALAGYSTIWMAVAADMGASLIVIFNSLRLLRHSNVD